MRRVSLYYGLTVLAMMFAVWACRRVGLDADQGKPEPKITVDEARAFFENQVLATKAGTGFGGRHDHPVGFSPGDFTPMWDRAVRAAANQWVEGVDLPIDPTFLFTASFPRVGRDGDTVYRTVDVVQKLVVNRWHDHPRWDGMYAYVATIIPTPEYYARHKNFGRKFVILGDKGEFSGWMIAHNMQGRMVSMARYVDGMKTQYWYDGDGSGIPAAAVKQMLDGGTVYSGTRAMYNVHVEAPDVFAYACQRCKMQDCHCKAGGGGCFCTIKDDTEETDPTPPKPPTPPIDGSGGNGGGGGGGGSTGFQTAIATKLFKDLKNSLDPNKWIAIESILEDLSKTKLGNFVINYLLNGGTITIVLGPAPGHEYAYGSYAFELNTLYIKEIPMLGSDLILNKNNESVFRQTMTEETFHAFQHRVYGDRFNRFCFEFEARVYGTIIMHMMGNGDGTYGGNMMQIFDNGTPNDIKLAFLNDLRTMTGDFTHGISSVDMKNLVDTYGQHCTSYGEGDANWEFIAIEKAGSDMGELQ